MSTPTKAWPTWSGDDLRQVREALGLTQETVGLQARLSGVMVSKVETGEVSVGCGSGVSIASALGRHDHPRAVALRLRHCRDAHAEATRRFRAEGRTDRLVTEEAADMYDRMLKEAG